MGVFFWDSPCSFNIVGKPCLGCGTPIEKFADLGGACYVCPACQSIG